MLKPLDKQCFEAGIASDGDASRSLTVTRPPRGLSLGPEGSERLVADFYTEEGPQLAIGGTMLERCWGC